MADEDFSFFVSHVRVGVRCAHAPALVGLRAVWGSCDRPLVPTREHARFEVERSGERFVIRGPHGTHETAVPLDVLPLLEGSLYAAMQDWHRELVALHAACIRDGDGDRCWVLLGPSGAGKSSLARAALRRGLRYYSDEITLCDGQRLWGVPRALQWSPLADDEPAPSWLGEVDRESYRLRVSATKDGCMPLWPPPRAQIASTPCSLARVNAIVIERSTRTDLAPLGTLETFGALHEAAYRPPALNLGALVRTGAPARLRWLDPEEAVDALLDIPG